MGCRNVALHSLRNWAQKQNAKYVWHLLKHKDLQASSKMVQTCFTQCITDCIAYRSTYVILKCSITVNERLLKSSGTDFLILTWGISTVKKTFFYKHTIQSAFIIYSSCYLLSDIYQQAGDFFPG